jgi:hypothetical protein
VFIKLSYEVSLKNKKVLSVIDLLIYETGFLHTLHLIQVDILSHVQFICTVIRANAMTPTKCLKCTFHHLHFLYANSLKCVIRLYSLDIYRVESGGVDFS